MKRRNVMIIIAASAILPVWGTVVDVRPGHIASVIEAISPQPEVMGVTIMRRGSFPPISLQNQG